MWLKALTLVRDRRRYGRNWRLGPRQPVRTLGLIYATVLAVDSGCTTGEPLVFVPVVARTRQKPSGWQAACLEALFQNMTTGDKQACVVGIGLPMHTDADGFIATWQAQELATQCITQAANNVVKPAPPSVPTALACMSFRKELTRLLDEHIRGSRVTSWCEENVPRTRVGFEP